MTDQEIVTIMCKSIFTNADITSISKVRGFSLKKTTSKSHFENFYLSTIGVEEVMKTLTSQEIIFLHYLALTKREEDITFFKRVYDTEARGYTFSERYKKIFAVVRSSLLRKGILLIREDNDSWRQNAKMERWRFGLPAEFQKFLPPMVPAPLISEVNKKSASNALRAKLLKVTDADTVKDQMNGKSEKFKIIDGELFIGAEKYSFKALKKWQFVRWREAVGIKIDSNGPIKAVMHVLAGLHEKEWASVEDIARVVKIFCHDKWVAKTKSICDAGWECGALKRHIVGKNSFFNIFDDTLVRDYEEFLKIDKNDELIIDPIFTHLSQKRVMNKNLRSTDNCFLLSRGINIGSGIFRAGSEIISENL